VDRDLAIDDERERGEAHSRRGSRRIGFDVPRRKLLRLELFTL
jgi:hypothetical protein